MGCWSLLITLALGFIQRVRGAACPGNIRVDGHGTVAIIPTGWNSPSGGTPIDVLNGNTLVPHQGARAYFAETCTAGTYNHEQYSAMNLLGKTMTFTTDLTGAGCGCNAALYLVSMHQNPQISTCNDYYCDANNVCGVSCAEIDIMEANQFAWHSTLHTAHDHNGLGSGYGGGDGFDGPRDWTHEKFSPGSACVDTAKPFKVAVSFPVDAQGVLAAMEVVLTQDGRSCPLTARVSGYSGMAELTQALKAGMTPVVSYWSSNEMLWMDGKGKDGLGPCASDNAGACSGSVKFSDFAVHAMAHQTASQVLQTTAAPSAPLSGSTSGGSLCPGKIHMAGHGDISVIPTGWKSADGFAKIEVKDSSMLVTHMGARGYFADTCTGGTYNNEQYLAMNLLGKTLRFTTDLSGVGCGCNAAFYLVSMHQNTQVSDCSDYYCDANNVCGVSCAEIDIMEANQFAWHSTLHTMHDHNGLGKGYGGGSNFNGPRDFTSAQYAPGGSCIDTDHPFEVAVTFPVNAQGSLEAMEVTLTQDGHSCPLSIRVDGYPGMAELSAAISAGMTPVFSYWSSNDMLWMDGKGADGAGPCVADNAAACAKQVKFYDFSLGDHVGDSPAGVAQGDAPAPGPAPSAPASSGETCPGKVEVAGHGSVSIIPTGWKTPDGPTPIDVVGGRRLVTHMGARGYFADSCTAGTYSNTQYSALKLLGKTLRFTTDISGAGCGCNAAFYLVSMRQNTQPSQCSDYYCDANSVCGIACAEIDIMEANQYAWHSTLHTSSDHNGMGKGYGGGSNFNGPRDWSSSQYGPGASCIDTNKPFEVSVSFPDAGSFQAMEVTLTQDGHSCPLSVKVSGYPGMAELSSALAAGMTPVFSYWSSNDMLWMDGKGADGQGPCASDNAASCSDKVKFYDFSMTSIGEAAGPAPTTAPVATPTTAPVVARQSTCPGSIRMEGYPPVHIIPTGWKTPVGSAPIKITGNGVIETHMGARGYFAEMCNAGSYSNAQYVGLKLLGKKLEFTVDLTGAGCGCNAAFYLVSMRQNTEPSDCHDYYCDANNIYGVSCAEIDIMEANQKAWHSTLHTSHDHDGAGKGYGGGSDFIGPRDWSSNEYGPGASCIDTEKPFKVAVSFPSKGGLQAMEVTLTQDGHSCPLSVRIDKYEGMDELSSALEAGMTPVFSYWSSDEMLWLDGKGVDGMGPCLEDDASTCSDKVQFYDFSLSEMSSDAGQLAPTAPVPSPTTAPALGGVKCPGEIKVAGHGAISIIPTGWKTDDGPVPIDVKGGSMLVTHMGARGYFADTCVAGTYSNEQYSALKLLGKTLRFKTDISGAGCGCNAAFYLVAMHQNSQPSDCSDYYCDANSVCGVSCVEIDIMEANTHAWHSTLHSATDHNGLGKGYGGGSNFNGPRDWSSSQYGPGASCIDTNKPFEVAVSFPNMGSLQAMEVTLTQEGHSCPLSVRVDGYPGMAELSAALAAGMTPVFSYWSSNDMLWMDGKGADGQGPCVSDNAGACSDKVKFYDFSLEDIGNGAGPSPSPQAATPPPAPAVVSAPAAAGSCPGDIKMAGHGTVSIIPTGWKSPDGGAHIDVEGGSTLVTHMGARGYFAEKCTAGTYSNEQYMAMKLLGKTLRFTTDLTGAGCGCNAAFYLVSMRQNTKPSECSDYYCDANNVCGVACAEIDIMEANQHAWHSTLHTSQDHNGAGKGYGGGSNFNGPRDWSSSQYGPGASCVDTTQPFQVEVSFPNAGSLQAMEVKLTQEGHTCPLSLRLDSYSGMQELSAALSAGMTPVFSYWSSDDMLWMDGKGADGQGPCVSDNSAGCSEKVKFYDFSLTDIGASAGTAAAGGSVGSPAQVTEAPKAPAAGAKCPGKIQLVGGGPISIVPTGWGTPTNGGSIEVESGRSLVTHMGARGYFAETCTAGTYSHTQYVALNLLGKTLRFTTDLKGAGCGCNAALYLVSMRQNSRPSECSDYYCDANSVCGESCAEIDIMEANMFAWHSTLHTKSDHNGKGSGYGGGDSFNGPRDFTSKQYGPGGSCVDTTKPFQVAVSFPMDMQGNMAAMDVELSQEGKSCQLHARVSGYSGMGELTEALSAGMTPVFSYWSSNDMLWMDGKGADGMGPCAADHKEACSDAVKFYDFSIGDIGMPAPKVHGDTSDSDAPEKPSTTVATTFPANNGGDGYENAVSSVGSWLKGLFFAGEDEQGKDQAHGGQCPGTIRMSGHGPAELVLTGWTDGRQGMPMRVLGRRHVLPHLGSRGYFAESCTSGSYDNKQYLALNLLRKTLRFTVDLSGAGCGCNAAFYLVSMRQNDKPSLCKDYYCDANKVCGVSCAEIDVMEANQYAWHSTLHTSGDHNGMGGGYGGGDGWTGPRDWQASDYGPGSKCVDTSKPFDISVSFPTDSQGNLAAMQVALSQGDQPCLLQSSVSNYTGIKEISAALAAGMTPVISYWSSDEMLWLDGKGSDLKGPCAKDDKSTCASSVKMGYFSVEDLGSPPAAMSPPAPGPSPAAGASPVTPPAPKPQAPPASATPAPAVAGPKCPGNIEMKGHGTVSMVPTGWKLASSSVATAQVPNANTLIPHMGSRTYFADSCIAGSYSNTQYLALELLGKTVRFTVDLAGAGCGCNAAFYLVSMKQNSEASDCMDYYCDANEVCGVSCAEIDIMEANQFAWHSTLHTAHDHDGLGGGFGGGDGWTGPRDWGAAEYAPGGRCVDTAKPFHVAVSFPVDGTGSLVAMEVTLTQDGKSCPLKAHVTGYSGMADLTQALKAGMTPVVSYWSSDMLWLDGKGADGKGPCATDNADACSNSFRLYDFSVEDAAPASPAPTPAPPTPSPPDATVPAPQPARGGHAGACPGTLHWKGFGPISVVPTGWTTAKGGAPFAVVGGETLVPHMGSRAYFGSKCTAGSYNNEQYIAPYLLGRTIKFTTDLGGAGCGCNAAFYLVSMRQNTQPSTCSDYYCDANSVCGVACAEIDIMEANEYAWHSTLHTAHDHNGVGSGYGGGESWNGPRDFGSAQYGPGAQCIDTKKPFEVAVSFPVNAQGTLTAMEVTLTQQGKTCPLKARVDSYNGMAELTAALKAGMTPVVSYWASNDMLWMDGKGSDGMGPCAVDNKAACGNSVKFYGFSIEGAGAAPPAHPTTVAPPAAPQAPTTPAPSSGGGANCPGRINVQGHGQVELIPTGWNTPGMVPIEVLAGNMLKPHMGARAYFAEKCTSGTYDHTQYSAINFLGKRVSFTVDLSGAGCGCNAAFYLVSMHQNSEKSTCNDYYCDANQVCGVSCAEIDIMEANQKSWHSTLHSAHDHNGVGAGYGGGNTWNGPRDWSSVQYGPGSSCVDTAKPFQVEVSFPKGPQGALASMDVKLSQAGKQCSVSASVNSYPGMAELSAALEAGMTPVVSYWSSNDMLWMDGKGADGQGPCAADNAGACGESVKMYGFAIEALGGAAPAPAPLPAPAPAGGPAIVHAGGAGKCPGDINVAGLGPAHIVPTGWGSPTGSSPFDVFAGQLIPHMGARAYLAEACTAGAYNNSQYMALNLLGKELRFTVDLKGAGCGCNAAFYLVNMRQNRQPSTCHDYYCDANKVCGVSCAEIDIMEANMFAWHSTLHTATDHNGVGGGYGGGDASFNGPRDWANTQYAPSSNCVDTTKPFKVSASFPTDAGGKMIAMEVKLSQDGHTCTVSTRISQYAGMGELTAALSMGMTPVVSYWSSDKMLWMDGKGSDGKGPCVRDTAVACANSIKLSDFVVETIGGGPATGVDRNAGANSGGSTTRLFFAGQDADGNVITTTPNPALTHGGHKLLMEVAQMVEEAAAKAAASRSITSKISFDCHAGLSNYQYGWSDMKKAACCHVANIPCPAGVSVANPAASAPEQSSSCSGAFQQCGGQNWNGPSCCQEGCNCEKHGDFYSQCTPTGDTGTCQLTTGGELTFMKKDLSDEPVELAEESGPTRGPLHRLMLISGVALVALAMATFTLAHLVSRCRVRRPAQEVVRHSRPYSSLLAVPLWLPEQKKEAPRSGDGRAIEASSPCPMLEASSPSPLREAGSPCPTLEASPMPTRKAGSSGVTLEASPSPAPEARTSDPLREAASPLQPPVLVRTLDPTSPSPARDVRSP